jgi:aspartate-semialdehyde dehydrogenase
VINGHSEAVFFRVSKEISREGIIEILENSPGVKVLDDPQAGLYPTPVENASDTEDVYVGRIRSQNLDGESWISMWIVADNVYGKKTWTDKSKEKKKFFHLKMLVLTSSSQI